jgi:serpin B
MKPLRLTAIVALLLSAACAKDPAGGPGAPPRITALPRALTGQEQQLIDADNRFAITLLKQVTADTRDTLPNLFISPLSVATALAMTYNGAAGTTEEAMRSTLQLDGMSVAEVNESYRSLIELLRNLDSHVRFQIANSIWYRQGLPVEQSFLDVNREYYDARVTALDFDSPAAPAAINSWVDQETNGLIKQILETIPRDMVMYLIDAIYFKGDWTYQFDPDRTKPRPFHLADGTTVAVPTMARAAAELRTGRRPNATIVDLSYGGAAFSMTIVVPDDTSSVEHLVDGITPAQWSDWTASLEPSESELFLPKFKLTNALSLAPSLIALGMGVAFTGQADFTRIHTPSEMYISEVNHNSYVDVNEEGTVAAAVTSVGMGITSVGPEPIIIDRPFVFALRENLSGTILFMGVIRHPATK